MGFLGLDFLLFLIFVVMALLAGGVTGYRIARYGKNPLLIVFASVLFVATFLFVHKVVLLGLILGGALGLAVGRNYKERLSPGR